MKKLSKFEHWWIMIDLAWFVAISYSYGLWTWLKQPIFKEIGYQLCVYFFVFTGVCTIINLSVKKVIRILDKQQQMN